MISSMKLALVGVLVCAGLAAALPGFGGKGGKPSIYEREGHLNDMRIRLGHFKEQPYIDLYKQYATAFVYPLHKHEYDKDDYRNYMPSGVECLNFFRNFRKDQYVVKEFNELIVLDACLGYLYDSDNHDLDKETREEDKAHIRTLKDDEVLRDLYARTKVNELNDEAKSCVADLLMSNVLAKKQFSDVECNNHFLQMFLQFAECQTGVITAEERNDDSYLKIVYAVLKSRAHICFETEVGHINQALRKAYATDRALRTKLMFKTRFSKKDKQALQQKQRMWPTPIVKLLAAVQDTKREINLREVHELLRGVYTGDEKLTKVFTDNIAKYATAVIEPKPTDKGGDQMVADRYRDLIDRTCKYFRSSDSEKDYDYATPLIRMVELLNHEDLFDITAEEFVRHMASKARETAPVYFSVSACNLLTFTEGTIPRPNTNTVQAYQVNFVDTTKMIKWPDAGYY